MNLTIERLVDRLLKSEEPSIRFKILVNVLNEDPASASIKKQQEKIRNGERAKKLVDAIRQNGQVKGTRNVYDKWQGTHWILATLADIGYPPGDDALIPAREAVLRFWLDETFYNNIIVSKKSDTSRRDGVLVIEGRHRRCASQQGYALFYLLRLGLADERVHMLAERLLHWQWPDGGWNCDKNPTASVSTFIHTLWAIRGLSAYVAHFPEKTVSSAIASACEVVMSRNLYKRIRTGSVIRDEFTRLHYPLYWHYDILGALKVLAEAGLITDGRCDQALDLLVKKSLPEGGWPAEKSYYRTSNEIKPDHDFVNWSGIGKNMNEWVTADALYVLKEAGKIQIG